MKPDTHYDVVIIGAGIAGVAAANYLATAGRKLSILLLDSGQALSLTTSKSGENFRTHWPQPCMAQLAGRSIELMEALGQPIGMKYSGYDFVSSGAGRDLFAGADTADGIVRIADPAEIREKFPYLDPSISRVMRFIRAGAVDVQALGSVLLKQARARGVVWQRAHVGRVEASDGGYLVSAEHHEIGQIFHAEQLLLTAGPFNAGLAGQLGVDLPVANYLQRKIVVPDPLGLIPTDMPFTICANPLNLDWSAEEQELIADDPEYAWLLDEFPAGLHVKPEPGGRIKLGWAYNRQAGEPCRQPASDPQFADVVMRGASCFIPALRTYVDQMPTPVVDFSGYYTRTPENWPLVGPLGPPGLYTVAALSGFGTMMACATGELIATWMTDTPLPGYAQHFHPNRYANPAIQAEIAATPTDGQL